MQSTFTSQLDEVFIRVSNELTLMRNMVEVQKKEIEELNNELKAWRYRSPDKDGPEEPITSEPVGVSSSNSVPRNGPHDVADSGEGRTEVSKEQEILALHRKGIRPTDLGLQLREGGEVAQGEFPFEPRFIAGEEVRRANSSNGHERGMVHGEEAFRLHHPSEVGFPQG
jgi:hypothetical protein